MNRMRFGVLPSVPKARDVDMFGSTGMRLCGFGATWVEPVFDKVLVAEEELSVGQELVFVDFSYMQPCVTNVTDVAGFWVFFPPLPPGAAEAEKMLACFANLARRIDFLAYSDY